MDVDKILMVDEEEEFSAIARLVELGRQKGYITLDDILHFFPEAEQDVEQLEEAFSALLSAGIVCIFRSRIEKPDGDAQFNHAAGYASPWCIQCSNPCMWLRFEPFPKSQRIHS